MLDRDVLDIIPAGARDGRRAAGGAGGSADDDGAGVQRTRSRVRPAGAGTAALGADPAAFLATDRPEPAQCVVRIVDRSGPFAADDLSRDLPGGIGGRICARDFTGPSHPDLVRCAVCAPGDRCPVAALSDLANPRRCTDLAPWAVIC